MQMVRLNVNKQNKSCEKKPAENVSLDEKIRRIQERNRERERRFQEVEQDKKLALDASLIHVKSYECNSKDRKQCSMECCIQTHMTKQCNTTAMGGVLQPDVKKVMKGRGQRLLEMSNEPSKAEHFKSRNAEEYMHDITLSCKCRTIIREKIRRKNSRQRTAITASMVRNENILGNDDHISMTEGQNPESMAKDQQKEYPTNDITLLPESSDMQLSDNIPEQNKMDATRNHVFNNLEQSKRVLNLPDTCSATEMKPALQKSNKPKIAVNLKKTMSSSSFEESMAMLSPLDCPINWGDIDSDDEKTPTISIWMNS